MPWLRADAFALNIVWTLSYYSTIAKKEVSWAWKTGATFTPISYGWAAGDCSLAAYIQSVLTTGDYCEFLPTRIGMRPLMTFCSFQVH